MKTNAIEAFDCDVQAMVVNASNTCLRKKACLVLFNRKLAEHDGNKARALNNLKVGFLGETTIKKSCNQKLSFFVIHMSPLYNNMNYFCFQCSLNPSAIDYLMDTVEQKSCFGRCLSWASKKFIAYILNPCKSAMLNGLNYSICRSSNNNESDRCVLNSLFKVTMMYS